MSLKWGERTAFGEAAGSGDEAGGNELPHWRLREVKSSISTFLTEESWQELCSIQRWGAGLPGFNASPLPSRACHQVQINPHV
jgi:hypothetical protein